MNTTIVTFILTQLRLKTSFEQRAEPRERHPYNSCPWFFLITAGLFLFSETLAAQLVIGGLVADTSARLDVQSSTRGVLLPRVSTQDRNAIVEPATGLWLYNTTTQCLEMNIGTPAQPEWTGIRCMGIVGGFDCDEASVSKALAVGEPASEITLNIPYVGGNGGVYAADTIPSSGVSGLFAIVQQGSFAHGSGTLGLEISGVPQSQGIASFLVNMGGSSCEVSIPVQAYAFGADTCGAYIAPGSWQPFLCHNLGAANTSLPPISASWEIQGAYWQWGRSGPESGVWLSENTGNFAHGPTGSGLSGANQGNIPGWSGTEAPASAWLPTTKTTADPCPEGFRVPPPEIWDSIRAHNSQSAIGSWAGGPVNYGSGRLFGHALYLPAAGYRYLSGGFLIERGAEGRYWTATSGEYLTVSASQAALGSGSPLYGNSIRCMSETLPGQIGSLSCNASSTSAALISGQPADGIVLSVPYSGGNGGSYAEATFVGSGISGLAANLSGGMFAAGIGTLQLILSGTPLQNGTVTFAVMAGGQSCDVSLSVSSGGGNPTGPVHCDPANPTVVNSVVSASTGRQWMDRNLGASRVAQSSTDTLAYGDLYQWGRFADGHQCINSAISIQQSTGNVPGHGDFITNVDDWRTPTNDFLWQGPDAETNPCPEGYRIPTVSEWDAERSSWGGGQQNAAGAFNSDLKLPLPGYRLGSNNSFSGINARGYYWSTGVNLIQSRYLSITSTSAGMQSSPRANGYSVRCIKH